MCRRVFAAVPWIDRDPDAEVEFETVPVDLDVASERAAQPVGEQFSTRRQRSLLGDHDEFVTPDAREKGALRRDLETPRSLAQRRIPHRMSEQVIDLLEAIQIDAKHRKAAAVLLRRVEGP